MTNPDRRHRLKVNSRANGIGSTLFLADGEVMATLSEARKLDHVQHLFTRSGLRCTSQRRALYQALSANPGHPTADQLFYEVSGRIRGMSLATVYNTLEAFCRAGLAQRLPGMGGSVRYEAMMHNHLHTRCEKSGAIHDVPDEWGQKVLESVPQSLIHRIEQELGFRVQQVKIELVGEYTGQ